MPLRAGDVLTVEVGPVVHGGHCIAHAEGSTLLVRHALPGEQVRVRIAQVGAKVSRADAIEVLVASPMRVQPPCPWARPDGCGGCDFQHARLDYQRELKSQVIADAFRRQARMPDVQVEVESVDETVAGLHWRNRMKWQVGPHGELGLHAHRSHEVIPVQRCLIAAAAIASPPSIDIEAGTRQVRSVLGSDGQVSVLVDDEVVRGRRRSHEQVRDRSWRVDADSFWQVHPRAAEVLVDAVLKAATPVPGERWWDLYAGAGLFSAFLAEALGASGIVEAVESNPSAVRDARRSLHDLPQVRLHEADVHAWLADGPGPVDGVVVDPPRSGLGGPAMALLLDARPRVIAYVACDPVALARDVATAATAGYRVASLRAFDTFPMTHHVELVAALVPDDRIMRYLDIKILTEGFGRVQRE